MHNYEFYYQEYKESIFKNISDIHIKEIYHLSKVTYDEYFKLLFYGNDVIPNIDISNFDTLVEFYMNLVSTVEQNSLFAFAIQKRKVEILLRDFFNEYKIVKRYVLYDEVFHFLFLLVLDKLIFSI